MISTFFFVKGLNPGVISEQIGEGRILGIFRAQMFDSS